MVETTKTIVLTLEEYSRLKDCETKLYELEAAAVDARDGYLGAMEAYWERYCNFNRDDETPV